MSSLDVILAGYSAAINDEDKLDNHLFKKGYEIATHDKPIFKRTPPARGTGKPDADEPASTDFKEGALGKVKGLIQVQEEQQANDALNIEGIQGELFPKEGEKKTTPKTGKEKALEDWRKEQGLEGTNVTPPWWNRMQINPSAIKGILQLIPALAGFDLQMAEAPKTITGPRTPGTIRGIPNLDSPFIDRWLKQQKQQNKPVGPQLPTFLSHNYRPGPSSRGIADLIIEQSNTLKNTGDKDKALELLKIATQMKLEEV